MREEDYPKLYRQADIVSLKNQRNYLFSIKLYLKFLVIGSALSLYGIKSKTFALIAALFFLASIGVNIWLLLGKENKIWYNARSVAESVKTLTWKFMMKAEPFNCDEKVAIEKFLAILKEIISQNEELLSEFFKEPTGLTQISHKMKEIRDRNVEDRFKFYKENRLVNQLNWYSEKAKENTTNKNKWFIIMIILQSLAVIFVICRIAWPVFKYWPPEVLAVASGGILSWIHVRKFRDLSSAYSLAASEINLINERPIDIDTEQDLSNFVSDTENAFSREHTQWIARKEH